MFLTARIIVVLLISILNLCCVRGDDSLPLHLANEFKQEVRPLIQAHCAECHDGETREAELDLSLYQSVEDVIRSYRVWETVLHRVAMGEMPPADASSQLSEEQRKVIVDLIARVRKFEAERNAGDPGAVIARRLSNAEFDYSVRDLTGADIHPTKTFPVDPANEAGFDNSGESLTMSPALMAKYLEACRVITDHMMLTPDGIAFAPYPAVTVTDRDKYCVQQIVEFYRRQPIDLADYFYASWTYRHCDLLGSPHATLDEVATQLHLSPKYLRTVWEVLVPQERFGPLAALQELWESMPTPTEPDSNSAKAARAISERMRRYVFSTRKLFSPSIQNLSIKGGSNGSQPMVLWKNKQYMKYRRVADFSFLDIDVLATQVAKSFDVPEESNLAQFKADCQRFCSVFPDAFFISERGRDYLDEKNNEGTVRLLSAGFHSMTGYFRDDQPLYDLMLDQAQQRELDSLWRQLMFVSTTPQRQYQSFLWFEKAESGFMREGKFDFVRSEDRESWTAPMIDRLAEVYLEKAIDAGSDEITLDAVRNFFIEINDQIQWVEQTKVASQPDQLDAVILFASRAYRRPLTATEAQEFRDYYHLLINRDGLSHEEAIQDTILTILMSPQFCYRVDLLCDTDKARPLNDYELASRLSFFLWSSIPDEELLSHAAVGDLHRPERLVQQVQRMLRDDRIRGFATEFTGNWLDFRRFEEHNAVDRNRFESFNDDLRKSMFEEPIRFMVDALKRDCSVLDLLYADRTFVNATLAKHYGIKDLSFVESQWVEVSDAARYGRGGLLPMAVFLTKNSPGLRTSPVKRGHWVVRRLLGERIPAPPPNVPEIPNDESQLGELTLRQTLAKHREHPSCAGCHDRIDSIGLAFEGYGPIGERREVDLGGRQVDTMAIFPDGSSRNGMDELRDYLKEQREAEFVDNVCRKLLSYALGRSLQLSDEVLLEAMRDQGRKDGFRIGTLVTTIVSSPPFLSKRGRGATANDFFEAGDTDE